MCKHKYLRFQIELRIVANVLFEVNDNLQGIKQNWSLLQLNCLRYFIVLISVLFITVHTESGYINKRSMMINFGLVVNILYTCLKNVYFWV